MMKKIVFICCLFGMMALKAQDISEYRVLMQKGEASELYAKQLFEKSKQDLDKTKKPIYQALHGVGNFFMAKHVGNPLSKYSYFYKGKKLLDGAIEKDPKNVEIRYMRYMSQLRTPSFLGYKSNMEQDKKMILEEFQNVKDDELKDYLKKYFKL